MSSYPVEQPFTTNATPRAHESHGLVLRRGEQVEDLGMAIMRCGLGVIFLWFGAMKFTSYEATGIAPFISNSPFVSWWYTALGLQGASYMLGVFELVTGALLLAGFARTLFSTIGGAMGTITFLTTLSFLFTTPGVTEPLARGFPALSAAPGQFLLKDLGLLGISLFILGSSLSRARLGPVGGARTTADEPDKVGEFGDRILLLGRGVLRYGLAVIFLWFGCMKFTNYEATGIAPFIMNSTLVSWWHSMLGIQGASTMLGVFEITTGVLLALCRIAPRRSDWRCHGGLDLFGHAEFLLYDSGGCCADGISRDFHQCRAVPAQGPGIARRFGLAPRRGAFDFRHLKLAGTSQRSGEVLAYKQWPVIDQRRLQLRMSDGEVVLEFDMWS